MTEADDLKTREECKRERMWDPRLRWQVLQQTITWSEAQPTVRRNTRGRCLELQRRKTEAESPTLRRSRRSSPQEEKSSS